MQAVKKESPFITLTLTQPIECAIDAVDAVCEIERMMEMYQIMLISWLTGDLRNTDRATVTTGLEGLFDALRYKTHALSEYLNSKAKPSD